jgi:hypothetical protein
MSYKPLLPYHLVQSAALTASLTGAATPIQYLDNISYQFNWSGNPTGSFSFQGSLDYSENLSRTVVNQGNWVTVPSTAASASVGTASSIVSLSGLAFPFIRPVYTRIGGSGSLDVYVSGKGI